MFSPLSRIRQSLTADIHEYRNTQANFHGHNARTNTTFKESLKSAEISFKTLVVKTMNLPSSLKTATVSVKNVVISNDTALNKMENLAEMSRLKSPGKEHDYPSFEHHE